MCVDSLWVGLVCFLEVWVAVLHVFLGLALACLFLVGFIWVVLLWLCFLVVYEAFCGGLASAIFCSGFPCFLV